MNRFNHFACLSRSIALLALFILFVVTQTSASEFVLFHTSDIHGAIAARPESNGPEGEKRLIGGYAALKSLVNSYLANPEYKDARIMYLDSGDFFQGTPIVDRTKGAVMIDFLSHMNVDAVTLGNHEFDYSYPNLEKLFKAKKIPVICCNVFEKATGLIPAFAESYRIFTHQGRKIGVIGVDTPETARMSFEKNVKDLIFCEPEPIVRPLVKLLHKSGVDFVILLSHLSYESDIKIASEIEGIDLIIGGHTHKLTREFTWAPPYNTPIAHPGSSCENVSIVHIDLTDAASPILRLESIPLYVDEVGLDPQTKELEDSYLDELKVEMRRVVGESRVHLSRGISGGDSPEGSLIADAMRKFSDADFAFINFGGVRQPFGKGPITVEDVFMVQPFDNYLEVIEMNGFMLRDLIERAYSNEAREIDNADKADATQQHNTDAEGLKLAVGPPYGILIPSGLHITYDPSLPPMKRLLKLTTSNGKELEAEKFYKVGFNDFVASGGDGFDYLRDLPKHTTLPILVRDALMKYIEEIKLIEKRPEKRVFNVKLREEIID
ncbi:MAG: bifunctional metallophosphatase/5'-nucleotidase [Candidatus Riflebacteria bacterium]|nr:bifunctional metallophosphatase/5'-nucleotidase [Candidatus Riflebacteria bacterium]